MIAGIYISILFQLSQIFRYFSCYLSSVELVLGDDKSEGGESGGVVLEEHVVVHAQHAPAGHVPPADGALLADIGKHSGVAGEQQQMRNGIQQVRNVLRWRRNI